MRFPHGPPSRVRLSLPPSWLCVHLPYRSRGRMRGVEQFQYGLGRDGRGCTRRPTPPCDSACACRSGGLSSFSTSHQLKVMYSARFGLTLMYSTPSVILYLAGVWFSLSLICFQLTRARPWARVKYELQADGGAVLHRCPSLTQQVQHVSQSLSVYRIDTPGITSLQYTLSRLVCGETVQCVGPLLLTFECRVISAP